MATARWRWTSIGRRKPGVQLPAVVCIHGGGWAKGNRTNHEKVAQALAARGYVAATISYRLSGEAPFPAAIHDCKAAVRFLRANAKEYGIDAEQIGAIGLSAGGHLTALLATSAGVAELEGEGGNAEFSSAIQAAVPMGAQTDLLSERTRDISALRTAARSGGSSSAARKRTSRRRIALRRRWFTSTRTTHPAGSSPAKRTIPARTRMHFADEWMSWESSPASRSSRTRRIRFLANRSGSMRCSTRRTSFSHRP